MTALKAQETAAAESQSDPLVSSIDLLIVDDDDATRCGLKEWFIGAGLTVDDAATGAAALRSLQTQRYGVVLLDVHLPDIGGLDILSRCASSETPPTVIVMTGSDASETALAALRGHAHDFISKPVDPRHLLEVVRRALGVGKAAPRIEVLSAQPEWLELLVPCTREAADRIQHFVQHLESDLPDEVRDSVGLAFRELLLNGIEWGGGLNPEQRVRVACLRTPRLLLYRIADPGQGFKSDDLSHASGAGGEAIAHDDVRQQKGLRPGGFGLVMIRAIADELIYNERRNEVLFIKYLDTP